jgi:hypothetical protein
VSPDRRSRAALAVLAAGTLGALAYGLVRAFVYLRGGGGALALVLRQQTVAYYQVLGVAAFVGLALGLGIHLVVDGRSERGALLERALAVAIVPAFVASVLFDLVFP